MKKIISAVITAALLTTSVLASGGILPLNHKNRQTSGDIVADMKRTAALEPAADRLYAQAFGDEDWERHAVDTGQTKTIKKGEKFRNSGLVWKDQNRKELVGTTCYSVAKAEIRLRLVDCGPVQRYVKEDCNNIALRSSIGNVHKSSRTCDEVSKPSEASSLIELVVEANASASSTVNNNVAASASTGDTILNFFQPSSATHSPLLDWRPQTTISHFSFLGFNWAPWTSDNSISINNENNNAIANTLVSNMLQQMVNGNGAAGSIAGSAAGSSGANAGNKVPPRRRGGRSP